MRFWNRKGTAWLDRWPSWGGCSFQKRQAESDDEDDDSDTDGDQKSDNNSDSDSD